MLQCFPNWRKCWVILTSWTRLLVVNIKLQFWLTLGSSPKRIRNTAVCHFSFPLRQELQTSFHNIKWIYSYSWYWTSSTTRNKRPPKHSFPRGARLKNKQFYFISFENWQLYDVYVCNALFATGLVHLKKTLLFIFLLRRINYSLTIAHAHKTQYGNPYAYLNS